MPGEGDGGGGDNNDMLSALAGAIFVIPGTPVLGFDGPGCLAREIDGNGYLSDQACRVHGKVEEVGAIRR